MANGAKASLATLDVRLENVEGNVENLWTKYDKIIWLLIGTLVTGLFTLAGVLFSLIG